MACHTLGESASQQDIQPMGDHIGAYSNTHILALRQVGGSPQHCWISTSSRTKLVSTRFKQCAATRSVQWCPNDDASRETVRKHCGGGGVVQASKIQQSESPHE